MIKQITILIGEMGSGKNYWGQKIANICDLKFFDGDAVVSSEILERVSKFKPLNRDMILSYVETLLNEIIKRVDNSENGIVVAQALYNNSDREYIYNILHRRGYDVSFFWVKTSFFQNMKQLLTRKRGWRWVLYWLLNKPFFQKPAHNYRLLNDETMKEVCYG